MPQPFEIEPLRTSPDLKKEDVARPSSSAGRGPSQMSQQIDAFIVMVRMYMQLNPRATMAVGAVVGVLLIKFLFFRHSGDVLYETPRLSQHYGGLQNDYESMAAKMDHWCLHGGDNDCTCDDPTDPLSRYEVAGWREAHKYNKQVAQQAAAAAASSNSYYNRRDSFVDVVFYGDGTTQAWTGQRLPGEPVLKGAHEVAKIFNSTFHKNEGGLLDGIALGIGGDSVRS